MKARDFRAARQKLDLTQSELARALKLRGDDPARTIRRYEAGDIEVTGPVETAMLAFLSGFRPPWWPKEE